MTEISLRDQIWASCDRAVENGNANSEEFDGSIYDCDPVRVAMDMLDTDADFEHLDTDDDAMRAHIIDLVRDWQIARKP